MASTNDARKELRRLQQQLRRKTQVLSLKEGLLGQALAVWWEAGTSPTVAQAFLAAEWSKKEQSAPAKSPEPIARAMYTGGPNCPVRWVETVADCISKWSKADELRLQHPPDDLTRRQLSAAQAFCIKHNLCCFTTEQNHKGLTATSLSLIERRDMLSSSFAGVTWWKRMRISNKDRMWVRRFASKWGLRAGRFKVGPALSHDTLIAKALLRLVSSWAILGEETGTCRRFGHGARGAS